MRNNAWSFESTLGLWGSKIKYYGGLGRMLNTRTILAKI